MRRLLAWLLLFLLLLAQSPPASAIYASPIQAGCYIAAANDCRVHVDPFTVNLAPGTKLVTVRLVLSQQGTGTLTTVYDWQPDQSNPAPSSGSTYSPSIPSQDLGVGCGKSFTLSLEGRDTGDASLYGIGGTTAFTCPSTLP